MGKLNQKMIKGFLALVKKKYCEGRQNELFVVGDKVGIITPYSGFLISGTDKNDRQAILNEIEKPPSKAESEQRLANIQQKLDLFLNSDKYQKKNYYDMDVSLIQQKIREIKKSEQYKEDKITSLWERKYPSCFNMSYFVDLTKCIVDTDKEDEVEARFSIEPHEPIIFISTYGIGILAPIRIKMDK